MPIDFRDWSSGAITTLEMRVIDRNAAYMGVDRHILMENAGRSVATTVIERYPKVRRILVVAGLGDNGGDGIVAAKYLHSWGREVKVVLLGRISDAREELVVDNLGILRGLNIEIMEAPTPYDLLAYQDIFHPWAEVIIDAIIGTGIKGVLREPQATAIELINKSSAYKVAVDIPSGLDPDTGEVRDIAVKAHVTVTMHRPKVGLIKEGVSQYVGDLVIADIGIPEEIEHIIGPGDLYYLGYARKPDSKKGDNGRVLFIGGSREFTGAIYLAAKASLRTGVDLSIVMAPRDVARDIRAHDPSIIAIPLDGDYLMLNHVDQIMEQVGKSHVIAIGPGLGLREETMKAVVELVSRAVDVGKKVVIDADAIKAIGELKRQDLITKNVIVTPHAGEFKWLTGIDVTKEGNTWSRALMVRDVVKSSLRGGIVLLKGNVDVITDGQRYKVNFTGNPGMTVGGTGDVLTGVVSALMVKVQDSLEAAAIGAFITGLAGDLAAKDLGYHITPTDVIENIPKVFRRLVSVDEIVNSSIHPQALRLIG
ncbi:carbohydrate kinase, YjeF related protein [Vulcanisaeta moutnovskia 768-28]|uniref:Bifunctional NAD(P)H-hydrate repair enzyme n=1 Tax=Vulcanisaeta moutnovskia (strain 768-28) TaxID=985053 RepID=F0QU02_VULM7|nr:bifunctional ADP-dependent NAD(P)H-hydrate dehydratase/NAD(P)H-hydrate epimerase [Vulcanisaeta moutnovskia]ADY01788.1 carbohydrate kinase, YjeF related protein [Vulcanisaeta moutnovskia 768-28]